MLSAALGAVAPVSLERLRREETLRLARSRSPFIPGPRGDLSIVLRWKNKKSIVNQEYKKI